MNLWKFIMLCMFMDKIEENKMEGRVLSAVRGDNIINTLHENQDNNKQKLGALKLQSTLNQNHAPETFKSPSHSIHTEQQRPHKRLAPSVSLRSFKNKILIPQRSDEKKFSLLVTNLYEDHPDDRSQSDFIEEENERMSQVALSQLNQSLNELRMNKSTLIDQKNSLKVKLCQALKLNQQSQTQKSYLINQLRRIQTSLSSNQAQKIKLLTQNSVLKNKIEVVSLSSETQQQKIRVLTSENRKLVDELNFQRQIKADFEQENCLLKHQMKKFKQSFQEIDENRSFLKQIQSAHESLKNKLMQIQRQVEQFRVNIRVLEQDSRHNLELNKTISNSIRQKQYESQQIRQRNKYLQKQLEIQKQIQFTQSCKDHDTHINILNLKEQQLFILKQQNIDLHNRIKELDTKMKSSHFTQILIPKVYTNSEYLTKILKESHQQILTLKEIYENTQDQLDRIKKIYEQELGVSRNRGEQIDRLSILLRHEKNRHESKMNEQKNRIKNQRQSLNNLINKLKQNESKLKLEILDKDRIIMQYLNKNKENPI